MTKIKTYGIYGVIERFIAVRLGKATMSIAFNGGLIDASGIRPATYTTKNPFEQKIVENHPEFLNKTIKIIKEQVVQELVKGREPLVAVIEEITTLQEARKYLLEKGVAMEELQNKAAVLEKAKELNISFPNWK